MGLKTSKTACYSFFNVKNNLHKWTFKTYINELKLYEKEQEKMNIRKEWEEGGPHNYKQVMIKVPVFILSIVSACLLEIYK